MKPIPIEIRLLVVAAKLRGESDEEIAKWMNIKKSTVKIIWKQFRSTGSVEPKVNKGRTSILTIEYENAIHAKVTNEPDSTSQEIIDELKLPIKKSQLSRRLIKIGT